MYRKRVVISAVLAVLCFAAVAVPFLLNGLGHSHAAGIAPTEQDTTATSSQDSKTTHPLGIVKDTIYYNSDFTSTYALDVRTGVLLWRVRNVTLRAVSNGVVSTAAQIY